MEKLVKNSNTYTLMVVNLEWGWPFHNISAQQWGKDTHSM